MCARASRPTVSGLCRDARRGHGTSEDSMGLPTSHGFADVNPSPGGLCLTLRVREAVSANSLQWSRMADRSRIPPPMPGSIAGVRRAAWAAVSIERAALRVAAVVAAVSLELAEEQVHRRSCARGGRLHP